MQNALYQSSIKSLPLIHRGKVRDIYAVGERHMLIVTSDRLSAFDVILDQPIPGKGAVLTAVSNFWFARTQNLIGNHLATELTLEQVLKDPAERAQVEGRAIVVRKLKPLPVEAIVRGYIIGSGWKDYQKTGKVCGIELPKGLQQADRLPQPIFTPST
ncbi:MAG: phosphoribosylaminoimidazolesuccinocarboxamide synthase, partial [Nevskiales bacterium]